MKLNKLFMLGLAGLAFAACSSDENASDAWNDSEEKSVQVSIANAVQATPESRSIATGGFSKGTIAVAEATSLKFLFLAGDQITAVKTTTDATTASGESNNVYTFHQISGSVNKVAIIGNVHSSVTIQANASYTVLLNTIKNQANLTNQQGDITNIVVAGESSALSEKGTDEHGKLYSAGEIIVKPLLARLEIGQIGCTNLGGAAEGGVIPLYKSLTLSKIGIDNIKTDFSQSAVLAYPEETCEAIWKEATTWCDKISDVLTSTDKNADGVYAYNVVPGTTPRIILQIDSYEKNDGVTTEVQFPWYVRADSYTGLTGQFEAGKIYQVKYQFACDNIKPWKPIQSICLEVEVIIPNWTIVELTPNFQ